MVGEAFANGRPGHGGHAHGTPHGTAQFTAWFTSSRRTREPVGDRIWGLGDISASILASYDTVRTHLNAARELANF